MSSSLSRQARSLLPGAFGVAGREMDDLFDRLFQGENGCTSSRLAAPMSVWEEGEHFHVEVELPGFSQDAIDVTFDKGTLSISGSRELPGKKEAAEGDQAESPRRKYLHNERSYGSFTRNISVPDGVDADSISAQFDAGVLHISLTKKPEVMPKKIEIKSR